MQNSALIRSLICAALWLPAQLAHAEWISSDEAIMGTAIRVEVWSDDPAVGNEAIAAVIEEMHRIDRLMSTYKPDSEISQVNQNASEQPVVIGQELFDLIGRGIEMSVLTGGAFDISYASAGQLYDFRANVHPDEAQLEEAVEAIDYQSITLDADACAVGFTKPGMRIDLGGIAKGYAVERGATILAEHGIEHGLVSAGGDTRLLGDRKNVPWIVGIRNPRGDDSSAVVARLPLADEAISTSGDYERYFEEDGVRYHHIISPTTGQSASEVRSVTIIGPDATMTDGLSTSVFVMGIEAGLALINTMPAYESVIVDNDGMLHPSDGFSRD